MLTLAKEIARWYIATVGINTTFFVTNMDELESTVMGLQKDLLTVQKLAAALHS